MDLNARSAAVAVSRTERAWTSNSMFLPAVRRYCRCDDEGSQFSQVLASRHCNILWVRMSSWENQRSIFRPAIYPSPNVAKECCYSFWVRVSDQKETS